jgi:hypothetical protein
MGRKQKTPLTTDDDHSIGDSDDENEEQGGVKMDVDHDGASSKGCTRLG